MSRILDQFTVGVVVVGLALAGCGGGSAPAAEGQVTAAVRSSARELEPALEREEAVARFKNVLEQLRPVPELAPLFELYQVPDPILYEDDEAGEGLVALLQAVKFAQAAGWVTITNRETGGVIYEGPRSDLASGTVHPENLPGGAPPPAPGACTYEYSAWGACQADGTQSRTVVSSTPEGCAGSPVLSQACTSTPPPPAPATCTGFTYSAWGACQPGGTQTRTVASSSPAGCTGGAPVTSQACTYVPPVTTCSSFTYSAWGACQPDNTQTRTVTSSSPAGCTGGSPTTTQACTYTAPLDGAALYTQSCASCHGALATSNLKGKNISVTSIKSRGMSFGLSDAQLQAIVTAVGP